MRRNDFTTISIKGRVAYAICCLENTLKYFNYDISNWRFVLEQLWTFTNIEYFDDWHYTVAEILPESVLEFDTFKEENFEYISEEQFKALYNLYKGSNTITKDIVKYIFDIGISELYGRLENYGQRTLDNLEILLNYMVSNNIPLPDINRFKMLSYDESDGWGKDFEGTEYSSVL